MEHNVVEVNLVHCGQDISITASVTPGQLEASKNVSESKTKAQVLAQSQTSIS